MTESKRWRFGFAATLVSSMAIGPLILFGLTAVSPMVVSSLGLSRAQFGMLAGVSFAVAMLSSVTSGRAVDRLGGRRILLLMSAIAGVAVLLVVTATSFVSLLLAVGLSGIAIAIGNPATNHLVSDQLAPRRRGTIVGLKQGGVPLTQAFLGLVLPAAALAIGWRGAMLLLLALPFLNIILTLAFVSMQPRSRSVAPRTESPRTPPGRAALWLGAFSFLMGMPVQATNAYMPLFGHEQLGLSLAAAGFSMTIGGALGLLARVSWGRLSDRLAAPARLLASLALASALGSLCLCAAGKSGVLALFWAGAAMHGAAAVAAIVVATVALVRSVDQTAVGRATGVFATGQFAGFSAGPVVFGLVVDSQGSYTTGWLCATVMYLAAGALASTWYRTTRPGVHEELDPRVPEARPDILPPWLNRPGSPARTVDRTPGRRGGRRTTRWLSSPLEVGVDYRAVSHK